MEKSQKHIRLSELNQKISTVMAGAFGNVSFWVVADITSHNYREEKGYHGFDLVEKDPVSNAILAKIPGKAWGNGSLRIEVFERQTGQKFTNNINVLVNVSVEFHPVYGLSLNLNDIDPAFTLGLLEQQRLAILEELAAKNPGLIIKSGDRYLTRNNQLQLNVVIQKIAVISSKTSAGGEDFRHTLENNPYGYKFLIDHYHTVVQGENNADQFLARIIDVFNSRKDYDVVVITRGGGAQTDFLMFDSYSIGRAVARFPIPIITGIGHQKNETIADLMAHTQTKTPTKAAEFIIAHNRSYEEAVNHMQRRIIIRSQQLISRNYQALALNNTRTINNAKNIISSHNDVLIAARLSIIDMARSMLMVNQKSLEHLTSLVRIARPDNIIKRGFAMIKSDGKIVSSSAGIEAGAKIDIVMTDGILNAVVNQKTKNNGSESNI